MARSHDGRKRTWRIPLRDGTTLEVATPPRATEKQVRRRGRVSLVLGTVVAALMVTAVAFADDISNDLDATIDASAEVLNLTAAGPNGSVGLYVQPRNGDGKNGCNMTGSTTLVVTVSSSNTGVATVSPSSITFGSCDDTPSITVTPLSVGSSTVTLTETSNSTDGTFNLGPATFTVQVAAAPPSDSTPPVITPTVVGTLGSNGWYTSDVTVSWSVVDGESPITSSSGCDPTTVSSDTPGTTLTCTATSGGGTDSASVTIKRDATAPTISGSRSPAANTHGWNNTDVTVTFTCNDATSGVASCGPNQTISSEGANQSASGTAVDNAGNSASATVSGINIDKTAPTVTCSSAAFILNQPGAQVSATVADALSGPVNATEQASADTSTVGPKSVEITGSDLAGNSTTKTCAYTVGYNFTGLFAPIDRPNAMNVSKAGQAIPLKWRLTDYFGNPVTDLTSAVVKVSGISCTLGTTSDFVEETAPGSSGLQNLGDGYYQFNWKTPTSYAGSCKSLHLDLGEGGVRMDLAYITFKK